MAYMTFTIMVEVDDADQEKWVKGHIAHAIAGCYGDAEDVNYACMMAPSPLDDGKIDMVPLVHAHIQAWGSPYANDDIIP